jgi:hypothetical protein
VSVPPVAAERYVTQGELAELLSVSLSTVKRWTRDGMPSECWGLRVRRYLPSQALEWAHARADNLPIPNQPPARRLTSAAAEHRKE